MDNVSRRGLLRNGSLAVVGAGLMGAGSTFSARLAPRELEADEAVDASENAALPAGASLDGPLVAHVKDLSTGEIGVYLGTSEVTVRDPQLAAKLYRTTTKG